MVLVTMDAAIGKQPDKMEPGPFGRLKCLLDHRITFQLSVEDRFVDPGEVLVNDSSSAEVEVANFRISHLAFGQSDIHPAGAQVTPRVSPVQIIVVGGAREQRCVAIGFGRLPAMGINPPSIPNNQHHRLSHIPLRLRPDFEIETADSPGYGRCVGCACNGGRGWGNGTNHRKAERPAFAVLHQLRREDSPLPRITAWPVLQYYVCASDSSNRDDAF